MIRVECVTDGCGWANESMDYDWTLHAGVVHERLKQGHETREVDVTHTGQHPEHWHCEPCETIRRRNTILHRALHAPEGLTPYAYTKGMSKRDALLFWVDAKALGLHVVGRSARGAKLLALPSTTEPA